MKYTLNEIFEKPISGEWGMELQEGERGVKVIRTTNFTNLGRLDLGDVVERNINLDKYKDKLLRSGDIIIEKSGGSPTQPVGRTVIFEKKNDDKYLCNNFTSVLRPTDKVYSRYVLYLLKDLYGKGTVLKFQNKTTGIINLKLNDYLQSVEVDIPSLNIQQSVAEVLDKAQQLIDKRKTQIEALDELVKSRFIEMFGDPVLNPMKWEHMELEKVCTKITDGEHASVERLSEGKLYLMARNVNSNNKLNLSEVSYISENDHKRIYKRCNPEFGDILMTCAGTIGNVAIMPEMQQVSFDRGIALLKPDYSLVVSEFLLYFLVSNFSKQQINKNIHASALSHLYLRQIKSLEIFLPELKIQNQFATFVNQVDKLKFEMEKSLKELENNFNSLMQRAFNGELFN
jgi:type I restriction enzyme, S subunit